MAEAASPRGAARAALLGHLGHAWRDERLLDEALTHPSWRHERGGALPDNQRLEFLGDAVLGLVASRALLDQFPVHREGQLTVLKSQLVRESTLAQLAGGLGLGEALSLGRGEARSGGRVRPSVLADALEALFGAVLLDGGFDAAEAVVRRLLEPHLQQLATANHETGLAAGLSNWKTAVQELLQAHGAPPPAYQLVDSQGPDHQRVFEVEAVVVVGDARLAGRGHGPGKRLAETAAAQQLYRQVLLHIEGQGA
jgi:ribonuclease-3